MKLPAYPAYKPSGAEWLGEIPDHWGVKGVKRLFRVVNGSTPESGKSDYWDGDIVWVTPDDLGQLSSEIIIESAHRITSAGYESCGTTLAPIGSIVLSTRAPIGHLGIAGVELCTNQGCRCLVPRNGQDSQYYYYQLRAAKDELDSWGQGSTFKELGNSKLGPICLAAPPLAEQRAIVAFLDRETGKIDALIAKKELHIELLQEKRTALISHAVTKGLDPNASMKDSGIKWLGQVPEHWSVKLVKREFDIDLGKMLDSGDQGTERGDLKPYLRAANIHWGEVLLDDLNEMRFSKSQQERYRLTDGDLLVTEGGVTVGRSAIWQGGTMEYYYQNSLNRARSLGRVSTEFLYLWMYFLTKNGYVELAAEKATFGHLTKEKLESIPFAYPPLEEQQRTIRFLGRETAKIDALIAKVQQAIETLKEYRTALISAAVTGKIDVRGLVS